MRGDGAMRGNGPVFNLAIPTPVRSISRGLNAEAPRSFLMGALLSAQVTPSPGDKKKREAHADNCREISSRDQP